MHTRSSSNFVGEPSTNPLSTSTNTKRCNRRRSKQPFSLEESPADTMADQRTMAELLRAPTEGFAKAIVVPPILAEHFELKHSLINMMTSNQFFKLEKDNPHDHIRWFNKITSTIKYKDVPNLAIKLMLFPFSLAGAVRRWLKKEPPHSILTLEDLVSKFINEFFPPSRTTNLRIEISDFEQRFGESFHEAWDRYKDLLRACPHHGFSELHQLDTFYNALNPTDQDSLNSAAGGNLLERSTRDVLTIIENKSKVHNSRNKSIVSQVKSTDVNSSSSYDIAKLTHAVNQQTSAVTTAMTAIHKQFQATPPPASVKAVKEIYVTCDGAHPYYQCLAADGNTFQEYQDNIQGYVAAAAGSTDPEHLGPKCGIRATRGTLSKKNHKNNKHSLSRSRKMSHPANEFSQHLSNDDVSNHEDASDNGDATNKPKQQQLISTATTISNIKLPILKKEEYDIWAMEMEHYVEYIDNDVWKVIQNGNSKKRISTRKYSVIRVLPPVSTTKIHVVEKERKARTILLMAIPKEHLRRFHGMDDAKEIWEAIRTSSEGLEKGYDRFQQLLSQLEAHGAEVSNEDANHKFLRALPSVWLNLAMTMRAKLEIDTLSIDDLYNNLRVFEQEIKGESKTSTSAQNVAFVSQSRSSTNKVKSGLTGTFSTCNPSTSSSNIPEREAPAGFADKVIYSLFTKQSEDLNLLHEDLERIDDVDIEEMDINWQIAMIAIRMKKFYKKTGRRVQIDGKAHVGFDKKKFECYKCHNTGHFARECTSKGTNDGKKKTDSVYQDQEAGKQKQNQIGLLTMDDGVVNWGDHTATEETNHALMAISSNSEVSLCSKTCTDSYNKLKAMCDEQTNQLGEQEAKILAYSQAVKKLESQIVTF
ncbi:reverse transcriptase domain-containing protein [Tanacetum coccineum]